MLEWFPYCRSELTVFVGDIRTAREVHLLARHRTCEVESLVSIKVVLGAAMVELGTHKLKVFDYFDILAAVSTYRGRSSGQSVLPHGNAVSGVVLSAGTGSESSAVEIPLEASSDYDRAPHCSLGGIGDGRQVISTQAANHLMWKNGKNVAETEWRGSRDAIFGVSSSTSEEEMALDHGNAVVEQTCGGQSSAICTQCHAGTRDRLSQSRGVTDPVRVCSLRSEEEVASKRVLAAEVVNILGPDGPGLLAVRGVPALDGLRRRLLPLAKKLALMPDAARRSVLKEHGLSTDVPLKRPDRPVSAFATQLQYGRHCHTKDGACAFPPSSCPSPGCVCDILKCKQLPNDNMPENLTMLDNSDLSQLGSALPELGACMVEVGLLVAQLCDSVIAGAGLEDAIWEAGSAKARLIHYHAYSEKDLFSQPSKIRAKNKFKRKEIPSMRTFNFQSEQMSPLEINAVVSSPSNCCSPRDDINGEFGKLWQQWHYDYGILTVLTAPMFLSTLSSGSSSCPESYNYMGGHSGLRIVFNGLDDFVSVQPDCLVVQVGEAAQIAAGGKLAAMAHCVCRPLGAQTDMSRETFVVFLQPPWQRVLRPPMGVTREEVLSPESLTINQDKRVAGLEMLNLEPSDGGVLAPLESLKMTELSLGKLLESCHAPTSSCSQNSDSGKGSTLLQEGSQKADDLCGQYDNLLGVIPPLASRWKEGCTFSEFARETTAQYYGGKGHQSQKFNYL